MLDTFARVGRFARSDFFVQSVVVFASSMAINALGYLFHFAISRRIGVVQYGELSALNAAYMICLTVAGIFATIVVKYVAELRAVDDEKKLAAFARRTIVVTGSVSAVSIVLGFACAGPIGAFLKIDDVRAVWFTVAIVAMTFTVGPLRAVFQGIEEFVAFSALSTVESLLKAILGIALVYAGFGVAGAFGGWAVGTITALGATIFALRKRFANVDRSPLFIDARRLARTAANVALAMLLLTVLGYFDVLVVKHYADPTTAGLYGALSLAGKILFFFVAFVPTVVLPKATRLTLSGESAMPIFLQAMGLVLAVSAAGLVVYALFPAFIVTTLAGAAFAPAAPYVFSYGVATVFLAALNVVVTYKMGVHQFDFLVPLGLVTAVEILGVSFHHRTLTDVISVLLVGNAAAFALTLLRLGAPRAHARPMPSADAA